MRILIVEDDPEFRHLLGGLLAKWGDEVVPAANGNEAWATLQGADPPRIAVLDWVMPGMTGLELCRKIRNELPGPYVYIIMVTAQQLEEDLVAGMEAGADDYVTKPLKVNEFRVRLNAAKRIVELQGELISARESLAARAADLETANRDLQAFSYAIANDVLISLLSIADNAKTIQDIYCEKEDQQCRSYTRRIYEKTKDLGQLVGVMLDFFRPNRIELRREPVDLSQMAFEAWEKFRKSNTERRVTFKVADGIKGNGDRALLRVVLNNLLDNAWKHTAGRAEAVIEFGVQEQDGKQIYFVRDNGSGFSMADYDRLFKPFQRLPQAHDFPGRGIGLATVERNIIRHGGRVWAEGEIGKGATFYFTLS
jgi:two-component system, sensor histidine kinase and response regulator